MKFNRLSPYMLTDNQENTFTLKPINCYNGKCSIELKVNGKKMTNAEMPGVGQIKISREHLQAVSMKGMILEFWCAVLVRKYWTSADDH